MNTTSINSVPTVSAPEPFTPVGNKELKRADFMKLFITQLQYQDPMEPMNSYEMASQLAQFSNMEATMQMSDNMEKLLAYQTSQNNLQLLSLIDKEVQAFDNRIAVVDSTASATEFTLAEAAHTCIIEIYNAAGQLVRTINQGTASSGLNKLAWDGKNMVGEAVGDGAYSYEINAFNAGGQQIEVSYRTSGKVTGVEFSSGTATLTIDHHIGLSVSDIITVK